MRLSSMLVVRLALLSFAFAFAFAACARPEPPTLVAKQATVTGVTLAGVDLRLQVEAHNPNGFDLTARTVTAKVTLDGKYDVGTVTVPSGVTLPAGKSTMLDVPTSVKWTDLSQLVALAAANRPIPFTVAGTAAIGGEKLNVDVPFRIDGTMTPEQLGQAATRSLGIPGMVPAH